MSEVKALPFPIQKVKTHATPHAPLVRMLEGMLESAKNGELQSVACACVYANDLEPGGGTSMGCRPALYSIRHGPCDEPPELQDDRLVSRGLAKKLQFGVSWSAIGRQMVAKRPWGAQLPEEKDPFRQFYEEGGYVGNKVPRKRLNLALWGSQYMAEGGKVPMSPLSLAYGSQYYKAGGQVDKLVDAMVALHRACGGVCGRKLFADSGRSVRPARTWRPFNAYRHAALGHADRAQR